MAVSPPLDAEQLDNQVGHKDVQDATCTFCGCVCDDIDLHVEGDKIVDAKRACVLGSSWFLNHEIEHRPSCHIDGKPAEVAQGVERAAQILAQSKYPLIYGLSDTTSESQRVAVSIADWIDGTVDTTTSVCHGPSGMAFQGVGEVTCSLSSAVTHSLSPRSPLSDAVIRHIYSSDIV